MKIYTGWVLSLENQEVVVTGSLSIRGTTAYILRNTSDGIKSSIRRDALLQGMNDKSILYIKSVVV